MGALFVPPEAALEGELAALRVRAYGADADIEDDPAALARLLELEEWHAATGHDATADAIEGRSDAASAGSAMIDGTAASSSAPPAVNDPAAAAAPPTPRRGGLRSWIASARVRLVAVGLAAAAIALVCAGAFTLWASPHPDAVLAPSGREPDAAVLHLTTYARSLLVRTSSLRAYETFRGVELWSGDSILGNRCLLATEPSSNRMLAATCVPPAADPVVTIYDVPVYGTDDWHEGLPSGTVARFILGEKSVSVWVYEGARPR